MRHVQYDVMLHFCSCASCSRANSCRILCFLVARAQQKFCWMLGVYREEARWQAELEARRAEQERQRRERLELERLELERRRRQVLQL